MTQSLYIHRSASGCTARYVNIYVPVKVEGDRVRANVRVEYVLELIVRDGARLVSAIQNTPRREEEGEKIVHMA